MAASTTLNKVRGSLIGVLMGDCLGAPFEGEASVAKAHVNHYFEQLLDPKVRVPFKPYTDDTAMTKSVGQSLVTCKAFNAEDMARRFTKEYFTFPKRGYGASIHDVFVGLRNSNFEDPFAPAAKQFEGSGSFGNGAAMRVTPIALVFKDMDKLTQVTTMASKITHANKLGYRGALLQCFAVRQALEHPENESIDVIKFADDLIHKMRALESKDPPPSEEDATGASDAPWNTKLYSKRLETVKEFLGREEPPPMEDIHNLLGVHVSALRSVPTAVYSFLVSQKPIAAIKCDDSSTFQRVIQFAISLGGDTDTIASMAGAMAGAHMGFAAIPTPLVKHCEAVDEILKLADDLHDFAQSDASSVEVKNVA